MTQDSLLSVKHILEKGLTNTPIRDVHIGLCMEWDTLSSAYVLTGAIREILPPSKISALQNDLNAFLDKKSGYEMKGTVFFDTHTDSALVHVENARPVDQIFKSAIGMMRPKGGMRNFSKRLHNYLNTEIKQGRIERSYVIAQKSARFMVERNGTLVPIPAVTASGFDVALGLFLLQEKHWVAGIWSGLTQKHLISIDIIPAYIGTDTANWPRQYPWAEIAPQPDVDIGNVMTFCAMDLNAIPQQYTVISVIYDEMHENYRVPLVHRGSYEQADKLMDDVLKACAQGNPTPFGLYRRVYFYR